LCALLLEAHPDWTPSNVIEAIKATAHDLGSPGPDIFYGWGLPDGVAALNYKPVTGITAGPNPLQFSILGNYPNPFNPSTTIEYSLPETGRASLVIYTVSGQKVRELASGTLSAGTHSVVWDGRDRNGNQVSSGIYISRLTMRDRATANRMLLVK
jgi:hypothetical protein